MSKAVRIPFGPMILALFLVVLAGDWPAVAAETSDEELIRTADARIEKHRKADVVVSVVDASGDPVPGAKVAVRQTRHAFLFGSNIFTWGRCKSEQAEAAYRKYFSELLNFATLGFYWASYEPQQGQPAHEKTEEVARWCQEQGILTKGHPLAWNYADPRWLPDDIQQIRRLQMARIEDCVSHFDGLIDRWDVVNEATHFDREEFVTRRAPKYSKMWLSVGQMEFTKECFTHGRKAGPRATLLINDYRVDPAYVKVIEKLVDAQGKPMYDVIGIQSHMHAGAHSNTWFWETCERFGRFGVPLHFTETTIVSGERVGNKERGAEWPSTPEGEAYQAREVARSYTMLFSHPAVEAVTWWDFSDASAWKGAPAGFLGKDMTPKPVYHELKKLIKGKWWTDTQVETGTDGHVTLRGFLGDYRVRVSAEGHADATEEFTLVRGDVNRWVLKLSSNN